MAFLASMAQKSAKTAFLAKTALVLGLLSIVENGGKVSERSIFCCAKLPRISARVRFKHNIYLARIQIEKILCSLRNLEEAATSFLESTQSDAWIGGNNLILSSKWNWTDGSIFDYSDWKKGEPQNITGSNCLSLSTSDGYWSSQDCFLQKPFICEIPATPNYPTFVNCSKGWIYFAPTHSCYGINKGGFGGNWTAANTHCESFDAVLPPITSFEEFSFIESYVYYTGIQTWTGVYSVDGGNTWQTTTEGLVANFLNFGKWCNGFPTVQNGERCISIGYNPDDANVECYRETDCSATVPYIICKKVIY